MLAYATGQKTRSDMSIHRTSKQCPSAVERNALGNAIIQELLNGFRQLDALEWICKIAVGGL